ncbi:Uncharacterized protein Rs2_33374 [Raphanus sativus]|nr:Uncharacterized protein Rs2_33374 [Raphanus sativus]
MLLQKMKLQWSFCLGRVKDKSSIISQSALGPSGNPQLKPISHNIRPNVKLTNQITPNAPQLSSPPDCKQNKVDSTQAAQLKQKQSTAGHTQPITNRNRFTALLDNEDQC